MEASNNDSKDRAATERTAAKCEAVTEQDRSIVESSQPAIARYEMGEAHIPADVLLNYANYFDVSLDYIYCRTDNPQGAHYENKPKVEKIYPEMEKFIEMCFDPGSPMNERLKESLLQMMKEGAE